MKLNDVTMGGYTMGYTMGGYWLDDFLQSLRDVLRWLMILPATLPDGAGEQ